VLHRFLEPPIAQIFERASDADRAADRIPVIGVKGEWEAVSDQPPHGVGFRNIARDIEVRLGPVIAEIRKTIAILASTAQNT
jgi:hypothetical protein